MTDGMCCTTFTPRCNATVDTLKSVRWPHAHIPASRTSWPTSTQERVIAYWQFDVSVAACWWLQEIDILINDSSGHGGHCGFQWASCNNSVLLLLMLLLPPQVHTGGLWEPWCEFSASPDPAKPSEPVSISTADSSSSSTSSSGGVKQASSSSGSGGVTVHGRRYRLAALNEADTRALPTKGKVRLTSEMLGSELTRVPWVANDCCRWPYTSWLCC
jgi:hypothetical protein